MNLKDSLNLAGRHLLDILWPEHNYLPLWKIETVPGNQAWSMMSAPAHNVGRWWDAMGRLEDATGFVIPADLEAAMLDNLWHFFDNPAHLCLYPLNCPKYDPIYARFLFELHSMREGLLALNALVRYRNCSWARKKAHLMMETIRRISHADNRPWDVAGLDGPDKPRGIKGGPGTGSTLDAGRFIEALVFYYRTSGDGLAMELAERFARFHFEHTTLPDGRRNMESSPNHAHSYFGTLRGLVLFGELTGRHEYIERLALTHEVTGRKLIKESGYICHDIDKETGGCPASAGDSAQMALWLARNGYGEFLDDVERIIRARLLPCQITDCPPQEPFELERTPDGKSIRYVNCVSRACKEVPAQWVFYQPDCHKRLIGAYGGIHPEIHGGKRATTDVTCAVLHSMCDFYKNIVTESPAGLAVNLHLDYEDDRVRIDTHRDAAATVTITAKARENLLVRIPGWAPPESVQISAAGKKISPIMLGVFAFVPRELLPGRIVVQYDLPVRKVVERTDGVDYEFTWRGDEIVGLSPNTDFFPFYPDA